MEARALFAGTTAALVAAASFVAPVAGAPTGAAFLTLNPSARLAGLETAGVGVVNDAASLFINPAGLPLAGAHNVMASHTELFLGSNLDALGYAQQTTAGVFGASALYLSRPSIETRDENRDVTGSLTSADTAVGLSYASRLGARLRGGLTVKDINQRIGPVSANSVAVDLGAQMDLLPRRLTAGLSVSNLGPGLKFVSERDALPSALSLGLGYSAGPLLLVADGSAPLNGGRGSVSAGVEVAALSFLSVRGGYQLSFDKTTDGGASGLSRFAGFGMGLGLQLSRYTIDIAVNPTQQLGTTDVFTVSSRF